jgi:hypothetical protein
VSILFIENVRETANSEPVTKMSVDFGTETLLNRIFDIPIQPINGDYNPLAVRALLNLKINCRIKNFALLQLRVVNPAFRDVFLKRCEGYCSGSTEHTQCYSNLADKDVMHQQAKDAEMEVVNHSRDFSNPHVFPVDADPIDIHSVEERMRQMQLEAAPQKRPLGKSLLARPAPPQYQEQIHPSMYDPPPNPYANFAPQSLYGPQQHYYMPQQQQQYPPQEMYQPVQYQPVQPSTPYNPFAAAMPPPALRYPTAGDRFALALQLRHKG